MTGTQEKINAYFERLVPDSGQADTVAGEIARAICRIEYHWLNDGDRLGEGYGRKTCNPSGRYLAETCDEKVAEAVYGAWRVHNDMDYEAGLYTLEEAVLEYLEAHPELETEKNEQDSRTAYCDPDQDVDEDEEDDEDWEEEEEYDENEGEDW